ncbi:MAG: beta-ketoacyl-ACP synthase, partial [Acaryochloridaceae cyanobacterium RL_2_7]|nr:beta-ketoacyl-ACP synthase [Acaryochloridaceae cyanobacterium RL_2_7]
HWQCEGPILAPRAACATGLWAIAQGADLIRQGFADVVIAGGIETPITPLTVAGFQKMGALSSKELAPFDLNRSGFILGEGAAILILESQFHAAQRQKSSYGEILGFGCSADGYHISAPNPDPDSAIQGIMQCLQRSEVDPLEIPFIHAHGTGTQLNDKNEAQIIEYLFPQAPFVMSSKGATGHTLGASGSIGTALCLLSLQQEILPPNIGLQTLDPRLHINVLRKPHPIQIPRALCLSFGFGGQNAALLLGRSPQSSPQYQAL